MSDIYAMQIQNNIAAEMMILKKALVILTTQRDALINEIRCQSQILQLKNSIGTLRETINIQKLALGVEYFPFSYKLKQDIKAHQYQIVDLRGKLQYQNTLEQNRALLQETIRKMEPLQLQYNRLLNSLVHI